MNMKVYCIGDSQIAIPSKVPGVKSCHHHRLKPLAISRLTGRWHGAILAQWAKDVQTFMILFLLAANKGDKTATSF